MEITAIICLMCTIVGCLVGNRKEGKNGKITNKIGGNSNEKQNL